MELFRVAIHYNDINGYIEYNPVTRKIAVILDDSVKRGEIEAFLNREHVIRVAEKTLRDFREYSGFPSESLATFKLALTQLWENTEVMVDWSKPVIIS